MWHYIDHHDNVDFYNVTLYWSIWQMTYDKHILTCFAWNELYITSHISDFWWDITLRNSFLQQKSMIVYIYGESISVDLNDSNDPWI